MRPDPRVGSRALGIDDNEASWRSAALPPTSSAVAGPMSPAPRGSVTLRDTASFGVVWLASVLETTTPTLSQKTKPLSRKDIVAGGRLPSLA